MKTLLLLRHAKSSRKDPRLADHDRPLNKRGKQDAPRMGRFLRAEGLVPDLIISSTATRALATAEAVARASGYPGEIQAVRELYLADSATYLSVLAAVPDECRSVLVVGHNPSLERLLEDVTGMAEVLPTAALARIGLPIERWKEFDQGTRGALVAIWRPREVE